MKGFGINKEVKLSDKDKERNKKLIELVNELEKEGNVIVKIKNANNKRLRK